MLFGVLLHYLSMKQRQEKRQIISVCIQVTLELCARADAGRADAVQKPAVRLSVNGPWLFEEHCPPARLPAPQTLSHYWTGATGPSFSGCQPRGY